MSLRDDNWIQTDDGDLREIHDVDLFDVSIVTYPAYDGTSVVRRIGDNRDIE